MQPRFEQVGPHRAQDRRGRRDREAGDEAAEDEGEGRRAEFGETDDPAQRDGMHDRQREQHAARADPVDEPTLQRRTDARARRQGPGDQAGDRERPGLLAQVEDDRESVDADRQPPQQRRPHERRHVRRAQDLAVAGHAPQASVLAWSNAASIIEGVSLPVNVFCWLG